MYEDHFGLTARPFGDSGAVEIGLPSRDAVRRRLRYGLEHGQGPALLFGPPGMGKTLLARSLARELAPGRFAHLTFPTMPAAELLDYLADELRIPGSGACGLGRSVRRIRDGVASAATRGERPVVIVDEAHLIDDPATFETLRLLLNFASLGPPDVSLLMVGGPEVLLHMPPTMADRLAARSLLGPLSLLETSTYVLGRLEAAGATRPLFDPAALTELHRSADGSPRRLNRLADLAMLIAYAEGLDRPGPVAVAAAARETGFDLMAA